MHALPSLPRRITVAATLLFVGLPTACLQAQDTAVAKKPVPVIDAVHQAMQQQVESGAIVGAVTLVGRGNKVVHRDAVGLANIEKNREMKPWNLFAIASMTKPVTATAVMILQDEGKLSVDDKVTKYLPEFASLKLKDGTPVKRDITIRDCLTHTAGLAGSQVFDGTLAEGVQEIASRPLAFQPGEKWQYSPGISVAGRIVEVVSGQSLGEFFDERIFGPLEMTQTTFHPDEKEQRRMATIYKKSDDAKWSESTNNYVSMNGEPTENPSAGLVSSARDLYRFYHMVLNGGKLRKERILSEDAVQQMTSPQTGDLETGFTPGNAWGLGWCVVQNPQGVTAVLSKGTFGHGGAFGTQGWVDPQTETVYVMLIQHGNIGNGDGSNVRKAFHEAVVDASKE